MTRRDPRTTSELVSLGWSPGEIRTATRRATLRRVRRGSYLEGDLPFDPDADHLLRVRATAPLLDGGTALSHISAALLWGVPLWEITPDERVWVTRNGASRGQIKGPLHSHNCPFGPDEVTQVNGLHVTTLERTVIDLGRRFGMDAGIVALDWALRRGASRDALAELVERARHRPGVGRVRRIVQLASPLAESAAESVSRLRMHQVGLPVPVEQFVVLGPDERQRGRSDFAWPELNTLGECDGAEKYDQPYGRRRPSEVVAREKYRDSDFGKLGWEVIHWGVPDLGRPRWFERHLRDGFERASRWHGR